MRSFNLNYNFERDEQGTAPVNLLTFGFTTPAYISDRDATPTGGPAHVGRISSWGSIDSSASQVSGAGLLGQIEIADLRLELINHGGAFSNLFAASAIPLENITVTLYQWFAGLEYSEKEVIFAGVVGGQSEYDMRTCALTIKGIWSRYNKRIGDDKIITAADFPGADPDDIGQMRNMLWGTCRNVKCRAVAAGMVDLLREMLTDVATSFYLSGSTTANMASGTRVVQIDAEQIQGTWNPSTRQLSSCTRGYNSSTIDYHNPGSQVAEVLTSYVYEIAGHPIKTIGAVRVDGIAQVGGYTAYTGQSGDELSGYEGTAVIDFSALPTWAKQVNLDVSEGLHSHTDSDGTVTWHFDTVITQYIVDSAANAIDDNTATASQHQREDGLLVVGKSTYESHSNAPRQFRLCLTMKSPSDGYYTRLSASFNGVSVTGYTATSLLTVKSDWTDTTQTWAQFNDLQASVFWNGQAPWWYPNTVEVWVEIIADVSAGSPATGVALSGSSTAETVIGKIVTVDVDGYKDDASGTITGTANALIERPDHVIKHLWTNTLSAPSGDIDSNTFTAAGSFYNTNTYKFGLAISQPIMADELLLRLALQCRSRFIVSPAGKARLLVRQTGQSSGHAIPKAEIKRDSVRMRRSSWEDLINAFTILYDRDHGEADGVKSYAGATAFSDSTSITAYGRREWRGQENLFWFDAVADSAMVAHVGAFYLAWHKVPRSMPIFSVFLDNMEIEPGDVIDVTHDLDGMSGFVCEVAKIRHNIGSGRKKLIDHLEIQAVEV